MIKQMNYQRQSGAALIVGLLLLALIAVAVVPAVVAGIRGRLGPLGVGVAAGVAAISLHSLVDFNFHIPSSAAIAVILVGSLLGLPWKDRA